MLKFNLSLGFFLSIFISYVSAQTDIEKLYKLYSEGFYDSTINESIRISNLDNPELWILKGKSNKWLYHYDSTTHYFHKTLSHHKSSRKQKVESLIGLCDASFYQNKIIEANELIKKAESLINYSTDLDLIPYFLFYKVLLDQKRKSKDKHIDFIKALESFSKGNPDIISYYIHFIDILLDEKELKIADKYFYKLEQLIDKFPNHKPKIAHYLNIKGYYLYLKGHYKKAIDLYENQLIPYINNENSHWAISEKMNYLRISNSTYYELRNFTKIIENYKEFIYLSKIFYGQDSFRLGGVYSSLSWIYNHLGNPELSNSYKLFSIDINLNQQNTYNQLIGHLEKGEIYLLQKNIPEAVRSLNKVISQPTNSNQIANLQFIAYFNLSEIYLDYLDFKKALILIKKGISFKEKYLKSKKLTIKQQYLIGKILLKNNKTILANKQFQNTLSSLDLTNVKSDLNQINFLNYLVNELILSGLYDSSLLILNKILPSNLHVREITGRFKMKNALVRSLYNKGFSYSERHKKESNIENLEKAYFHFKQSIELIELNRKSYKSASDRISQFDNENFVFESIIGTAYKLFDLTKEKKYLNDIYYYTESNKSNQLLESLNRNHAIKKSEIPDSILLNINDLKQQASYLESKILKLEKDNKTETDSIQLNLFKTTLVENKVSYQELILDLEKNHPNYYQLNYNQQIADLTKTQANLKPNEALIEYLSGDSSLFVFTITQKEVNLKRLEKPNEELIKRFQETVQPEAFGNSANRLFKQFASESHELYQNLLGHPLTWLKENSGNESIAKLYIIPDKSLNYLPFDLLIQQMPKEGDSNDFGSLDYLINDYTVSYGYSATILFRENLVKDRTYHGSLLAVAPSYSSLLNDSSKLSKLGKFRDDFSELLFNKQEVDNIGQYFDGTILKNEEATEKAFLENLPNHDIVHLAMHAMVDNEKPTNSRLIFSPDKDTLHDNYLHNFELYNMNIPTRLAVLSACNTGYGNLRSGEGVISLARAFTYAGAESVVMSHWRVDDQSSSSIMKDFYKYLADGQDKDEALRLAKLDYLANASPLKQHPFYWNNFVIVGDVSPFDVQSKWYQAWYVYLVGVLVVGLGFRMVFRKRNLNL